MYGGISKSRSGEVAECSRIGVEKFGSVKFHPNRTEEFTTKLKYAALEAKQERGSGEGYPHATQVRQTALLLLFRSIMISLASLSGVNKMSFRAFSASLLSLTVSAFAIDPSFQLVKHDDKVSVYSKRPESCVSDGASVMFVVENKTKERLELKLELLSMKVKNRLTVLVEPSGNTSVLSLSPDAEACKTELVDMKVSSLASKIEKPGDKSFDRSIDKPVDKAVGSIDAGKSDKALPALPAQAPAPQAGEESAVRTL
jgi:hypothetical protein